MAQPTHDDIERLLKTIVLPFCHIERDIPLPHSTRRFENDAEHSWSVAFLACALAPQIDPRLDLGKIAQYAIAHDLVEVYADDTSTFADAAELATKEEREAAALKRISHEFAHFPWIVRTIEEYEQKATDEAKFVYALDKYIPIVYDYLDEGRLFRERKITLKEYNQALKTHRRKAQSHPVIGQYYDEVRALLDAHPEYFHA
jgi:putative hydrolase of HD superfamily